MSQDNEKYHSFQQQDRNSTTQEGNKQNIKQHFMYGTDCLDISKLLQALPTEFSRFGSHSLDKATEFIPEILSSSQISHCIPLNHCKLLSKALTVTPWRKVTEHEPLDTEEGRKHHTCAATSPVPSPVGWSPPGPKAMLKTCTSSFPNNAFILVCLLPPQVTLRRFTATRRQEHSWVVPVASKKFQHMETLQVPGEPRMNSPAKDSGR